MSDVFLLTRQPLNRIKAYFPVSHGISRGDDPRGYLCDRYSLQWKDAPTAYRPQDTLPNTRFVRWSRAGIFYKIFRELSQQAETREGQMIDAIQLKAHQTAASLLKNGQFSAVLAARKIT